MGGAAREPFPTMNLRQGAGSGFGREVGRLVGGPGAEQHCRLGVSVGTRGVKKRRGLGPLAVGEDEEEDHGGPVPAGLRGGGSRKQLTHTGPGWDMGACHRQCRRREVGGRYLQSRFPRTGPPWAMGGAAIALCFPWAGGGRADQQGPGRWWGCRGPDQVEVKAA